MPVLLPKPLLADAYLVAVADDFLNGEVVGISGRMSRLGNADFVQVANHVQRFQDIGSAGIIGLGHTELVAIARDG